MNKKLVLFLAAFVLSTGVVLAEEMAAAPEVPAVAVEAGAPAAVEVGNKVCPLTGRELNLADANDYTKMEVSGLIFNVCPTGKAAYDKDPSAFAEKVAAAVTAAQAAPAAAGDAVVEEAPAAPAAM